MTHRTDQTRVAEVLDPILGDVPVRPAPTAALLAAGSRHRRRRRTTTAAGVAAVVAVSAGVALAAGSDRPGGRADPVPLATQATDPTTASPTTAAVPTLTRMVTWDPSARTIRVLQDTTAGQQCREVARAELDGDVLELVLRPPTASREGCTVEFLGALSAVARTGSLDRRPTEVALVDGDAAPERFRTTDLP